MTLKSGDGHISGGYVSIVGGKGVNGQGGSISLLSGEGDESKSGDILIRTPSEGDSTGSILLQTGSASMMGDVIGGQIKVVRPSRQVFQNR